MADYAVSTGSIMKALFICSLLTLTAAKPQQVSPQDLWAVDGAEPYHHMLEIPFDDDFENRNPEVTEDGQELFEADMVLTAEQRDGRQAVGIFWTSPISFAISSSSAGDRAAILRGIQHWRDHTCLQFEEVAEGSAVPHIKFIRSDGCWSYFGKVIRSRRPEFEHRTRLYGTRHRGARAGSCLGLVPPAFAL